MSEIDLSRWILTIDAGLRFLGKAVHEYDRPGRFALKPAFEYMTQVDVRNPNNMTRMELAIPVDLVGEVTVNVQPTAYFWVGDLPKWRQEELKRVIEAGMLLAERQRVQKDAGLILP